MTRYGNNGSGKSNWYGLFGTMLAKLFTGEVMEGFNVQAQTSPNMTIKVLPGSAMIPYGSDPSKQAYLVRHDTSAGENVTITTASGSNPRNDLIIGYYKTSVVDNTNPNNPGALRFIAVAGVPASTPADPNATAIQNAIVADGGVSSDPYIILGRVVVPTSATQITNPNIADLRSLAMPAIPNGSLTLAKMSSAAGEVNAQWQTWTPTIAGFSVLPPGATYRYKKIGTLCTLVIDQPNDGTSNSTAFNLTLPVNVAANAAASTMYVIGQVRNGGTIVGPGLAVISKADNKLYLYINNNGNLWTASGAKRISSLQITFECEP